MTSFNDTSTRLEKNLNKKIIAGEIALRTNENSNTNELVLLTIQTLEYIKRAYNEGKKEIYQSYVKDGRFNEPVQKLIYNSPVLINPHFLDIPLEEIPEKTISHYSKLMNLSDKGDYYEIDARKVATTHFTNEDVFGFYSKSEENPYSLGQDYRVNNNKIPISVIFKSLQAVRTLVSSSNYYYSLEDMMHNKIIIAKKDFDYEAFIHLYEFFYFDLFMNVFHKKLLNTIEIFKNIQFVPSGTKDSYSFEELRDYELDFATLQEFASVLYYEYRFKIASSDNYYNFNCNLKNIPLDELSFSFTESKNQLADVEQLKKTTVNELYEKNKGSPTDRHKVVIEDKLKMLNKKFYAVFCERLYEIVGIKDLLSFNHYTQNLTRKIYSLLDEAYRAQEELKLSNEKIKDMFEYLNFSSKIKESFTEKIEELNNEIIINLEESEDYND